ALAHWTPVHVHLAAQDVTGRVALLDTDSLAPGQRCLAQLVLNAPAHAVHGDPLVLRDQSALRTLGGGRVLDPFAPARGRRLPARLMRSEEHTSELQSRENLVCRLLHEKKKASTMKSYPT